MLFVSLYLTLTPPSPAAYDRPNGEEKDIIHADLGTAVAQWLRCCATKQNVAGSIPEGVIGIFHRHNPSDRTTALGSTQPLTEMTNGNIYWG